MKRIPSFLIPALAVLLATFGAPHVHALISEPDNILYGLIGIAAGTASATSTHVRVEARCPAGVVASYRMGDDPAAGDFYRLVIPVESVMPLVGTNAAAVGSLLDVVVLVNDEELRHYAFTILDRGVVMRVDLAGLDDDEDGISDAWELFYFHALNVVGPATDYDHDGMCDVDEAVAGSDPTDSLSLLVITAIQPLGVGASRISWQSADGRLYTVQIATNGVSVVWHDYATGLPATPSVNSYDVIISARECFFRVLVESAP